MIQIPHEVCVTNTTIDACNNAQEGCVWCENESTGHESCNLNTCPPSTSPRPHECRSINSSIECNNNSECKWCDDGRCHGRNHSCQLLPTTCATSWDANTCEQHTECAWCEMRDPWSFSSEHNRYWAGICLHANHPKCTRLPAVCVNSHTPSTCEEHAGCAWYEDEKCRSISSITSSRRRPAVCALAQTFEQCVSHKECSWTVRGECMTSWFYESFPDVCAEATKTGDCMRCELAGCKWNGGQCARSPNRDLPRREGLSACPISSLFCAALKCVIQRTRGRGSGKKHA
jgi:hypothetical protein